MSDYCVTYHNEAGRLIVLDLLRPDGRTQINGRTLDECRAMHADAAVMSLDDAARLSDEQWVSPVKEITRDQFHEMLNVLPPVRWKHYPDAETFYMSEFTSGRVTDHFCRIGHEPGARYFVKSDLYTLDPIALRVACRAFIEANPSPTVRDEE